MSTKIKRVSISVTSSLNEELAKLKREHFPNQTNSEMLRELIVLGLSTNQTNTNGKKPYNF